MTFPRPPSPPIITHGQLDGFLASEEEAAEIDRLDAEAAARDNAATDAMLTSLWACTCCGLPGGAVDAFGRVAPDGLCSDCRAEERRQKLAEAGQVLTDAERAERVRAWRQQHDQQGWG